MGHPQVVKQRSTLLSDPALRRRPCASLPLHLHQVEQGTFTPCQTCSAHTEKATLLSQRGLYLCRQRPTLPHTFACSTIGPAGLNFRVRYGNGWIPRGKITDNLSQSLVVGR
jgi:hypothetical protein